MSDESRESRRDRRIRWIGAVIVVLGAVAGGVILALDQEQRTTSAAIVVAVTDRGPITLDVATTGTVEPATTRALSFGVGGTVAAVPVRPGNRVVKGQKLATLDGTDTTDAVTDAQSQLAEARTRLTAAKVVTAHTTASATTCARPARSTPAAAAAAVPALPVAPAAVPVAPDAAAAADVAAAAADVEVTATYEIDLGSAVSATPCATQGFPDRGNDPVLTAEQQVNRAARAVEKATTARAGATITAPIAGTVVAVSGSVGDQVRSGAGFVSLADTYTMQVRADFPEADAGSLAVGQNATVTLAGADAGLDAAVVQVDPAGTSDGTLVRYGVLLAFAASPDGLLVGQSAQVKVRTGEVADALRVPSTAVHDVSTGAGTVLVRSGNRSAERLVTVGLRGDQYTEILDGLSVGDQVVRSW
ncbi:efflux RND transporter periplasmic adaptor subunit [Actinoplanes derwentensis]|uniref:HlyD family secretion protein n=1 Tax=Actinoplanes derwentensis TaxID=113562 RepID=A0A1H2ANV1_9ACTN|nr:HlyD family efflux transporter periplasmic adaptor subunit [Actinoplanes derwentensis]GID84424.1 hypothetical protein Ade03nite_33480 [Actinoplanes derwentensis]SDT47613.1 HlyD family secretion protein [Actinoplanes derwentensis]